MMYMFVHHPARALWLVVLLSFTGFPLAASTPADGIERLVQRQNITNITSTTITTPTTAGFFEIDPVGITRTLPWWTSLVGGAISFFLGVYTISWGWKRQRAEEAAWSLSGPTAFKTITTAVGLFWTLFQSTSGLVHLGQNWGARALVRPVSGNAYIGMFAMAAQLWSIKIRGAWKARIAAWIVTVVVIANFVLFTLPVIGSAPLYQLSSEWCATVLDSKPSAIGSGTSDCSRYDSISQGAVSFTCANMTNLQFREAQKMPQVVNYVFEGALALMFLATLLWQIKTDFDWWSWRRSGAPTVPLDQSWQPQGFMQNAAGPGYNQEPYNNRQNNNGNFSDRKSPYSAAYPVENDNRDPLRRDAYFGTKNPHRYVAYAMAIGLYATNLVGVASFALAYYASKSTAVAATLGVCPGTSNSTSNNVTAIFGTQGRDGVGNCTCVDLRLPGSIESLPTAFNISGTNLARFLFNI
jgi:hypothetical protein